MGSSNIQDIYVHTSTKTVSCDMLGSCFLSVILSWKFNSISTYTSMYDSYVMAKSPLIFTNFGVYDFEKSPEDSPLKQDLELRFGLDSCGT